MAKSAIRRHHIERLRRKRSKYYGGWAGSSERTLGIVAKTPALCSRTCCGNPRRHFGAKTRQEKINAIELLDGIG